MSHEAFVRFREAVMQSAALQAELVDTVKSQADLLAMGRRLGFEFDATDVDSRQLTEEELRHVAGGVVPVGHTNWTPLAGEKWINVGIFDEFVRRFSW